MKLSYLKMALPVCLLLQTVVSSGQALKANKYMVFSKTPAGSNKPAHATQSFKATDFIYGRVYFNTPVKEVLFLEKNSEGTVPIDIYVEDITNGKSMYLSLDLAEEEMEKNFFEFDILPDTARILRSSKEFETGRFTYFCREESLEKKKPVFKFTVGDAVGYIQVDFTSASLEKICARDRIAYDKSKKEIAGEETR